MIEFNKEKMMLLMEIFNDLSDNGKDNVLGETLVEELVKTREITESEARTSISQAILGCLISPERPGWYIKVKFN